MGNKFGQGQSHYSYIPSMHLAHPHQKVVVVGHQPTPVNHQSSGQLVQISDSTQWHQNQNTLQPVLYQNAVPKLLHAPRSHVPPNPIRGKTSAYGFFIKLCCEVNKLFSFDLYLAF